MRILVADAMDASALAPLVDAGHEVSVVPELNEETLVGAIGAAEVVVVRSTKVTAAAIAAGESLSLIVRAGAGVDNIDTAAASGAGVYVCNVPGRNSIAVAELALALLLAVDRHIADGVADLRAGRWDKKRYSKAKGLAGRTLGIVGVGDIGLAVAERAKAFGMWVIAVRHDGRPPATQASIRSIGIRLVDDLETLAEQADVVSLHVPKAPDTVGMVDAAFLARMPQDAVLINTARGDVVDGAALLAALDAGRIYAGLDVWPSEPKESSGEWVSSLAQHPRVVGTHHIGASTDQAQAAVAAGTVEAVLAFAAGEPINVVNLAPPTPSGATLTVRHLDRVGVLAQVFAALRSHGLNVEHMWNQIFDGAAAAVATIHLSGSVQAELLTEIGQIPEVLAVTINDNRV